MCQRQNCYELLWKIVNAKENPWTVNSQYRRRRASQKTDVKKTGRREDQDEEDQRKTSKLIAYLSIKSENCIIVQEKMQCFVNSQIGVFKIWIVYSLNIIQIFGKA